MKVFALLLLLSSAAFAQQPMTQTQAIARASSLWGSLGTILETKIACTSQTIYAVGQRVPDKGPLDGVNILGASIIGYADAFAKVGTADAVKALDSPCSMLKVGSVSVVVDAASVNPQQAAEAKVSQIVKDYCLANAATCLAAGVFP